MVNNSNFEAQSTLQLWARLLLMAVTMCSLSGLPANYGQYPPAELYAEQMDADGLGRKLLLTPSRDLRRAPEKQTVGTVTVSHKMLTLQALLSSLNAGPAKRSGLGQEEAFGCPPAVCPPRRPRPFAHYRRTNPVKRLRHMFCIFWAPPIPRISR